jgi:hypothetical protein
MVEQQERVEVGELPRSNAANQMHPGAFDHRFRPDDLLDRSNGHQQLGWPIIAKDSGGCVGADARTR